MQYIKVLVCKQTPSSTPFAESDAQNLQKIVDFLRIFRNQSGNDFEKVSFELIRHTPGTANTGIHDTYSSVVFLTALTNTHTQTHTRIYTGGLDTAGWS